MKWIVLCAVLLARLNSSGGAPFAWTEGAGFRTAEVRPQKTGETGFTSMNPSSTGILFTNILQGDASLTNAVAHNGSGLAIGDVDGDGSQDIYLCNLQWPNTLYRNLGNWRFAAMEIGDAACANDLSTGATFADVDGDSDLDLLVNGIAMGTRLFLNDGKGRFVEQKDSGLSRTASATSLALGDIDGDSDLDLYCTHYIDVMHLFDPTTKFSLMKRDGRWVVLKVNDQPTTMRHLKDRFEALPDGRVRELPEVDGFYRNDGKGRFTAIQSEPGIFNDEDGKPVAPYRDWGLSVMFRDMNRDGHPDIYVCNDNASRSDRVWINSGKGTFRAMAPMMLRHTSRASMGIDFADIDRDGHDDFIVVDMLSGEHAKRMTQLFKDLPDAEERERIEGRPRFNRNMLFFGRPDGTYAEAALMAGVAASEWSWCPIFIDVDLDGYEDLLITNGFEYDMLDQDSQDELKNPQRRFTREQLKRSMGLRPHYASPNAAFRNRRDGTFEPIAREWGFDHNGISWGMALGDLDNDGDLDVVVNNLNEAASVYRNNAAAERIAVRLKGRGNTQGVGARVRLIGAVMQSQEMISGGRYVSGDQAMRVFAAGESLKPTRLEVTWRNGAQTIISNVQPNRVYEIDEASAVAGPKKETDTKPIFRDVSALLNHTHAENAFDDWASQPSLPRRLSRLGPGVSWFDINGDGWEDLIVGSGASGKLGVYTNSGGGSFTATPHKLTAAGDQGAVLGFSGPTGQRKLLVGVSNYEIQQEQQSEIQVHSLPGMAAERLPAGKASTGPMAMADIDSDGDLDLFVGGRFRPRRYPEPVSSAIWVNEGGALKFSEALSRPFEFIGLVSGATFTDFSGDGLADLALALEWGPVAIFRNGGGGFHYAGSPGPLGWWTGITAGDFDCDGRMDLAVGNWGRNSMYELYRATPDPPDSTMPAFYGSWNSDGTVALVETWRKGVNWLPVHNRNWISRVLPEVAAEYPRHAAFAAATVQQILGARLQQSKTLAVSELRSGILLNRGLRFEWVPFPREAQLSPVFSVNVGDFNADGNEDLFLSQNCFSAVPEDASAEAISRDDSGRGLWLRGTGRGSFTAVDGSVTGIKIYGEQRGAAVADFNHDGRVDLCVSQNGGATKLYIHESGKRGLRVTLRGPAKNPDAIGTQMRVRYAGGRMGPSRAVTAGGGYWSQDASAQVLGLGDGADAIWIRWPNGTEQTVPLVENQWDVRADFPNERK